MILGVVLFLLYLYFFIGFQEVAAVVQTVDLENFFFFYSLAVCTMLMVVFFWVASWKSLLDVLHVKLSFRNAFQYYWVGYFVDLIVPVQSVGGEVTRMYLVQRETKSGYGAIAASGVTNRIIAYVVVISGLSIGSVYLLAESAVPGFVLNLLLLTWVGALIFLVVLLYLAFASKGVEKLAAGMVRLMQGLHLRKYSEDLSPKVLESLVLFREGFNYFRAHPRHIVKPLLFQLSSFALSILMYIFVFYALGFTGIPIAFFIVVYFLAGAVDDAAGVLSVGTVEILLTSIFIFYSIPAAKSGVTAVVLRTLIFWIPLIVGYIIVHIVGIRGVLNSRTREAMETEERTKAEKESVSPKIDGLLKS